MNKYNERGCLFAEKNHFDKNDDQRHQEHKQRYTIYPMHIAHPGGMRRFRVALFDIEVFRQLSPDFHGYMFKITTSNLRQENKPATGVLPSPTTYTCGKLPVAMEKYTSILFLALFNLQQS